MKMTKQALNGYVKKQALWTFSDDFVVIYLKPLMPLMPIYNRKLEHQRGSTTSLCSYSSH